MEDVNSRGVMYNSISRSKGSRVLLNSYVLSSGKALL